MKYKEDSAFPVAVLTSGDNPIDWTPKTFKYEWLELWSHSGTTKVGIANIAKAVFWKGTDFLISGPAIIQTGIYGDVEWLRVVRKTADSIITENTGG